MTKKNRKKKVRVKAVRQFVAPDLHEVVLEVHSVMPPPVHVDEPIAVVLKKRGVWAWLLGAE